MGRHTCVVLGGLDDGVSMPVPKPASHTHTPPPHGCQGGNLTVVFLGGSITAGQGAVDGHAYPTWFRLILQQVSGVLHTRPAALARALQSSCHFGPLIPSMLGAVQRSIVGPHSVCVVWFGFIVLVQLAPRG